MTAPALSHHLADLTLATLAAEREELLSKFAHVLRRVGPDHPKRKATNAKRAITRKALRKKVRANAFAIAARVSLLYKIKVSLRRDLRAVKRAPELWGRES